MTKFIGRRVGVGLARESTRGTLLSPKIWMRHTAVDIDTKAESIASEAGQGRIEKINQSHAVSFLSEGKVEGEVGAKSFGLILYSLLGSLTTTQNSPVASSHTHAFSLAQNNQHPLLALCKQDPDITKAFTVMPTSTTITIEPGKIVSHSTDIVGLMGHDWSTQTITYPTGDIKFLPRSLEFKVATNIAGLGAASGLDVKKLELTINQNAVRDDELGSQSAVDIINQSFEITGSVELLQTDQTWRNYMLNNTNRAMEIKLTSQEYVTGTTPASLDIQMPNIRFFDWEKKEGLNDVVTQAIKFEAMYDLANSQAAITTCTLINGEDGTNY